MCHPRAAKPQLCPGACVRVRVEDEEWEIMVRLHSFPRVALLAETAAVTRAPAPCPRLDEQRNRKGGLVYSALTRGALIYAFAMLGSGGIGPDY